LTLITFFVLYASAPWSVLAVPNGSFEDGTLCTVPDQWIMRTWNRDGEEPVPGTTYINEVCENGTRFFSGSRSCWLHSKVVDTDGTVASRGSWTWIESENPISQPSASHVRFYIMNIQPTHSLGWGWNDGIYLGFNDTVWDITNYKIHIYNNGETLNFNNYNGTKVGADGATWYEYIYPIPPAIDKTNMRIQIMCFAGDWTFYDTSYFADMTFYVDNVELLYTPTPPLSISISPTSASINVGNSVVFASSISGGTSPYSCQWYLDESPVSGATSSSWTFTPTTDGIYYVYLRVTDAAENTAQSENARITVTSIPVGGYSLPLGKHASAKPLTLYLIALSAVAAGFIVVRRKTPREF
jgi:hypothetical protein